MTEQERGPREERVVGENRAIRSRRSGDPCPHCPERIKEGDLIVPPDRGRRRWMHLACWREAERAERERQEVESIHEQAVEAYRRAVAERDPEICRCHLKPLWEQTMYAAGVWCPEHGQQQRLDTDTGQRAS